MRTACLFIALFIAACHAMPSEKSALERTFADPRESIEIRYVGSAGNLSEYRLTNTSLNSVRYYHSAGQGPEPVAYCRSSDESLYICTELVFLEGDDEAGYIEFSHDAILEPRETVTFKIRSREPIAVGIKFPIDGQIDEVILWSQD
jgi:hypothetical protein